MGWYINCVENTLKITEDCALELFENGVHEYYWDDGDLDDNLRQVYDPKTGLVEFNPDHMEHQDFLWDEEVQAILLKHKANGRVLWTSADGDNAGQSWGYEFKDGVLKELSGTVHWS